MIRGKKSQSSQTYERESITVNMSTKNANQT